VLQALQAAFGDRLYVELQRHGLPSETSVEAGLLDLAYASDVPIVATNEPHFSSADDYERARRAAGHRGRPPRLG
jgi:DNA polymerase-3 subunit alpha